MFFRQSNSERKDDLVEGILSRKKPTELLPLRDITPTQLSE